MSKAYWGAGVAIMALIAGGAWWWQRSTQPTKAPAPMTAATPVTEAPVAASAATPAASAPIAYPVGPPVVADRAAAPQDIESVLRALFGREAVLAMFQVDDFPRRLTATVDNLGREHAPSRLWPVNPTPGRFTVLRQGEAQLVGADNAARYTPFVLLAEAVDLQQAVAEYTRFYPLFQRAYEELGYPKRYFNDRLVEVIDLLLATPDAAGPLRVHPPNLGVALPPQRPWVLYEFDDPALQSLTAGQKILLRMGPAHERRVKARLAELRRLLTARAVPR